MSRWRRRCGTLGRPTTCACCCRHHHYRIYTHRWTTFLMQPRVELIDGIGLADAPSGTAKMHVSFSFAASLIYFFRIQRRSFRLILVPGNSAAAKHHVYCFLSSTSSSRSATSVNQHPPPQVQHRRRPSELLQVYNTAMMTSKLNNLYVHFYSRSLSVFALGRCVMALEIHYTSLFTYGRDRSGSLTCLFLILLNHVHTPLRSSRPSMCSACRWWLDMDYNIEAVMVEFGSRKEDGYMHIRKHIFLHLFIFNF
jgi:hypothetical protein